MNSIRRFAIQRTDGSWYAGSQEDGSEQWIEEAERALIFERYEEAVATLERLRRDGHQVQLFGLA